MNNWYTDGPVNPPDREGDDYCAECDEYECEHIEYVEPEDYDTLKEYWDAIRG